MVKGNDIIKLKNSNLNIGKIHHVFRQKSPAPWQYTGNRNQKWPKYKFIYVLEGKYMDIINGQKFIVSKDESVLIKKGDCHYSSSITVPFDYIEVEFDILEDECFDFEFRDFYHFSNPEQIKALMLDMYELWNGQESAKNFKLKVRVYELLICLVDEELSRMENYSYRKIKDSITYIEENCFKKYIEIKELAEISDLSISQFNRIFKKIFYTTPTKYMNNKRIKKAKALLAGTNYPVIIIAEECGFSDNYYFSKIFKQQTGLSPLKYRAARYER